MSLKGIRRQRSHKGAVAALVAGGALLGACVSSHPYDYRNIPPRWTIAHSPIPVPHPKLRPPTPAYAPAPSVDIAASEAVPAPRVTQAPLAAPATPIKRGESVRVRKGDTLYAISRRTGQDLRTLIEANRLSPPYRLTVGQELSLGRERERYHVVERGETGYGISRRYGVDVASLMRLNHIRPPYRLAVGRKLRLPGGVDQGGGDRQAVMPPVYDDHAPRVVDAATGKSGYAWPLLGQVVSGYGPKEGGLHNDGINIAAKRGAPVRAARDGVVVYADNGLRGFGNLILIKHADGWITAYAHNEHLLVSKGQRVQRGQLIARAGATGSVRTPQLHFEIRAGRQAVDPRRHLPRVAATAMSAGSGSR